MTELKKVRNKTQDKRQPKEKIEYKINVKLCEWRQRIEFIKWLVIE